MTDGSAKDGEGMHLTPFEREVVVVTYEEQERFEQGRLRVSGTIWSRVIYRLAQPRGLLRPSPVAGKAGVDRHFEHRIKKVADALVSKGVLRRRKLAGYGRQHREQLGHKLHARLSTDLSLTRKGRGLAQELAPRHDASCLRACSGAAALAAAATAAPEGTNGWATAPCPPAGTDGVPSDQECAR